MLSTLIALTFALAQEPRPAWEDTPDGVSLPLAGFARLTDGEWRMTKDGEAVQFDTWTWGPGRHSVRSETHGVQPDGEPWRVLDVFYWHPGLEQVRVLALHQDIPALGRGVAEGAMVFDGEIGRGELVLHQPGAFVTPRWLALEWDFEGPGRYRETLLEGPAAGGPYGTLASWDYVHDAERTPAPPLELPGADRASSELRALAPLLGQAWTAGDLEVELAWLPLVEVVHARVHAGGEPLLEAYAYHHPTADELRVLALDAAGGARTGTLTQAGSGILELALAGHTGERAVEEHVELAPARDGGQRLRVWTVTEGARELAHDVVLERR